MEDELKDEGNAEIVMRCLNKCMVKIHIINIIEVKETGKI
jgi:hypothetical protein